MRTVGHISVECGSSWRLLPLEDSPNSSRGYGIRNVCTISRIVLSSFKWIALTRTNGDFGINERCLLFNGVLSWRNIMGEQSEFTLLSYSYDGHR